MRNQSASKVFNTNNVNNKVLIMAFRSEGDKNAYWQANVSLVAKLLSIWFIVSFCCGILFVDILNSIRFFGFKLGFWFAHQGAIYVFVVLIFVYAHKMNQIDKRYNVEED